MKTLWVFVNIWLVAIYAKADDIVCPSPPDLPKGYYARLLVNSNGKLDDGAKTQRQSTVIEYITDGLHNVTTYYQGGSMTRTIYDSIRNQVIMIQTPIGNKVDSYCIAKEKSSTGQWELGEWHDDLPIYGADLYFRFRKGLTGKKNVVNSTCLDNTEVHLIPVNVWYEEAKWDDADASYTMTYAWSDNSSWVPDAGQNPKGKTYRVPVSMSIKGSGKFGNIDEEVIVTDFLQDEKMPSFDDFSIPDGIICANLSKTDRKVPKLPKHFSFVSEIVVTNNQSAIREKVVYYQTRYYDSEFNLTRLDMREVAFADHVDTENETVTGGVVSIIHDFYRGIEFKLDRRVGKCYDRAISYSSDDVTVVNQTHVIISNPMHFMKLDNLDFLYYKTITHRGIKADQFRAFENGTGIGHELLITSRTDDIQGDHIWDHQHPMKHTLFNELNPDDPLHRMEINIFNFDKDQPNIAVYDINDCFNGEDKQRFEFIFAGSIEELNITNMEKFRNLIQLFLVQNTKVSPLRITHIDRSSRGEKTYVTFTLLPKLANIGDGTGDDQDDLESTKAIENLISRLQLTGNDRPYIMVPGTTVPITIVEPNSLLRLDQLEDVINAKKETTYTPGSMAGLGVGMIILGVLIGAGACFLYILFRGK